MVKTVTLHTYRKILSLFQRNSSKQFTPVQVRDLCHSDYNSVLEVLGILIKEGDITQNSNLYSYNDRTQRTDKCSSGA